MACFGCQGDSLSVWSDLQSVQSDRSFALAEQSPVLEVSEVQVPQSGHVAVLGFQHSPVVVAEGSGLVLPSGFSLQLMSKLMQSFGEL